VTFTDKPFRSIFGDVNVKNIFTSHIDKKIIDILILYLYTFSLYEKASLIIFSEHSHDADFDLNGLSVNVTFVCLYNYEFGLSLCKIVRSSVILLLPLFKDEADSL
jgi:hypothetical protein